MRESEPPPEVLDWPADAANESFVMLQTSTGRGRRRARLLVALSLVALVVVVVVASAHTWVPTVGRGWARLFPPPPYRGAITVVQERNEATVRGLRADTGQVQWSFTPISTQNSQPILVGETVVGTTVNGIVGISQSDGHRLWFANAPPPQGYADPIVSQGGPQQVIAWYPSVDGQTSLYHVLDVHTGALQWQYQIDGYPFFYTQGNAILNCAISPATAQGVAAYIVALDDATGKPQWTSQTVQSSGQQGGNCFTTASSVYLEFHGSASSDLWAFSLANGQTLWHRTLATGIAINDDQHLYTTNWFIDQMPTEPSVFTAYDATTGALAWQTPGQYASLTYGTLTGNVLSVKTPTGVAGIDTHSGALLWHFDPPGDSTQFWLANADAGNTLYYVTATRLYALDVQAGKPLWSAATSPSRGINQGDLQYHDHRVYLTTDQGVTVFDATSGRMLWHVVQPYYLVG